MKCLLGVVGSTVKIELGEEIIAGTICWLSVSILLLFKLRERLCMFLCIDKTLLVFVEGRIILVSSFTVGYSEYLFYEDLF